MEKAVLDRSGRETLEPLLLLAACCVLRRRAQRVKTAAGPRCRDGWSGGGLYWAVTYRPCRLSSGRGYGQRRGNVGGLGRAQRGRETERETVCVQRQAHRQYK